MGADDFNIRTIIASDVRSVSSVLEVAYSADKIMKKQMDEKFDAELMAIQCCRANATATLSSLPYYRTATASMQQCAATNDATLMPPSPPLYRHYRRYCRCQAILLPCCRHDNASAVATFHQ